MHRQRPTGPVRPSRIEPVKDLHLIPADPLQPPVFPECTSIPVGPTSHYFSLLYEIIDHLLRRRARQNLRSEEHTSELQSRPHLVCRLLLEKKKEKTLSL